MKALVPLISIALLAGCAAPPPVRIASSILGRSVLKKEREQYQGARPEASPTQASRPAPAPQS